jgi:hypothetical protein
MGKIGRYTALASRVLIVAVERTDGWCAYCDAVPGYSHDNEYQEVARVGDKIQEKVARVLFPEYDGVHYAE